MQSKKTRWLKSYTKLSEVPFQVEMKVCHCEEIYQPKTSLRIEHPLKLDSLSISKKT